eukprot:Gb_12117 [translate_table: standard]
MAIEKDKACINLFSGKCNYNKFKIGHIGSVHAHGKCIHSSVKIVKLNVAKAEAPYRDYLGSSEFSPLDIDAILKNKLSMGAWVAVPQGKEWTTNRGCVLSSWGALNDWNNYEVFKLEVKGISIVKYVYVVTMCFFDKAFLWLKVASI